MANDLNRRQLLGLGLAAGAAISLSLGLPRAALALDVDQARGLIDDVVNEINRVISSGGSEAAMLTQFEALFARYADVPVIARSVLGPAGRQASPAQITGFT
jgi:phospholipid transport system substrate-binding protein